MGSAKLRTVCNRDCPDACGLVATVEEGRLVALGGAPHHPAPKGVLCFRPTPFPEMQNGPLRITTPLLRRNGSLEEASWEEALGFVADRLLAIRRGSGPPALLPSPPRGPPPRPAPPPPRSGVAPGLVKSVVDYFFELLGPVTVKRGDICSGAGDAAQEMDFGEEDSHDIFDLLNARNVILW